MQPRNPNIECGNAFAIGCVSNLGFVLLSVFVNFIMVGSRSHDTSLGINSSSRRHAGSSLANVDWCARASDIENLSAPGFSMFASTLRGGSALCVRLQSPW